MNIKQKLRYRLYFQEENTIETLLNLQEIDSYSLSLPNKEEIVDVYYDNQNFNISKSSNILLFRVVDFNSFSLTFKTSQKKENQEVVSNDQELEETISIENLMIIHKNLTDIGMQLQEFNTKDFENYGIWGVFKIWDLREIFVCETTRHIRKIYENEIEVAVLYIDDILISTFGKKQTYKEIKIQFIDNNNIINNLSQYFELNYKDKLFANQSTKHETGIKLLLGERNNFEN